MAKKEEKEVRREKRRRKKRWLKTQVMAEFVETNQSLKRSRSLASGNASSRNDWEQIAAEERMAKKVRKGDISQKLFDTEFSNL